MWAKIQLHPTCPRRSWEDNWINSNAVCRRLCVLLPLVFSSPQSHRYPKTQNSTLVMLHTHTQREEGRIQRFGRFFSIHPAGKRVPSPVAIRHNCSCTLQMNAHAHTHARTDTECHRVKDGKGIQPCAVLPTTSTIIEVVPENPLAVVYCATSATAGASWRRGEGACNSAMLMLTCPKNETKIMKDSCGEGSSHS